MQIWFNWLSERKAFRCICIAISMPLFLMSFHAHGQLRLSVPVKISVEGGSVEDVTVYLNNNTSGEVSETPGKGRMNLELVLGNDYVLTFSKKDYITKRIAFNTAIPTGRKSQELYPFNFEVVLFPQYDGLNIVVFNQPVAKIYFDPLLDDFDYDTDYTKQIQSALKQAEEQILAKQKEEKSKTEQRKKVSEKKSIPKSQDSTTAVFQGDGQTSLKTSPSDSLPDPQSIQKAAGVDVSKANLESDSGTDNRSSFPSIGSDLNNPLLSSSDGQDKLTDGDPISGNEAPIAGNSQSRGGDDRSNLNASIGKDVEVGTLNSSIGIDSSATNLQRSKGGDMNPGRSVPSGVSGQDSIFVNGSAASNSVAYDRVARVIKVDEYTESGKNILNIVVLSNGSEQHYRKVRFHWGGVYYYKSGDSISQAYFFAMTGYR